MPIQIDSRNNIYYIASFDAGSVTNIGTDIGGNTVTITADPTHVSTVFVKMNLTGDIIWYRQCDYTATGPVNDVREGGIEFDENNNIIWFVGRIVAQGSNFGGAGSANLLAHPYTGVDTATKTLRGNFSNAFIIGFDENGNMVDFETVISSSTTIGDSGFNRFTIDQNGDLHIAGYTTINNSLAVSVTFPNSTTGDIVFMAQALGFQRIPIVAKYSVGTGFDFLLTLIKEGNPGGTHEGDVMNINSTQNELIVTARKNNANSGGVTLVGFLYTSGAGSADTVPQITIPAALTRTTFICKINISTYQPIELALIEESSNPSPRGSFYDNNRGHIIVTCNNTSAVTFNFYNGYSGVLGASVATVVGNPYIARLDSDFIWRLVDEQDVLTVNSMKGLDENGNIIMFHRTADNITLGGINYPTGGLIYALYDINGNYIFSRKLSDNTNLRIGTFITINDRFDRKYYFCTANIDSTITENGITLTHAGGSRTALFLIFDNMKQNPVGISISDVTVGNPVSVKINNVYTVQNTVLTTGNNYYNEYGTLTTTSDQNIKIGTAISPTQLLLTHW
jgi:hypothetical protein